MRVAIIHYWLVNLRGGEKVLQALCDLFPNADIYTHVHDPELTRAAFPGRNVYTTFINSLPAAMRLYQNYLPLMPAALKRLDLSAYDLVISCESGPAKGVSVAHGTPHICYCHTPMRYAWDLYDEYRASAPWFKRLLMPAVMGYMRRWDVGSAKGVTQFVANSHFVADRIRNIYDRDALVIHPPVAVDDFVVGEDPGDFYLLVGQLVPYKRADLAVEAFNRSGRKLIVIGEGEQLDSLRRSAGKNIRVLGRQPFSVIRDHYSRCKALIFPGVEDFGIVPVEAMASGRPVIAFGKGGATETVKEHLSGLFFHEQTVESLNQAISEFEAHDPFDAKAISAYSREFAASIFKQRFQNLVNELMKDKGRG